jgi:hypothetical protein
MPYEEPTSTVEMEILKADYVIELARSTVLYTKTFRKAINCGTKFYFLSGIEKKDFYDTYSKLNPKTIEQLGEKLLAKINSAKRIKFISPDGKKLDMVMGPKIRIPPILKRFHYSFLKFHSGILDKKTILTFPPAQLAFRGRRYSINGELTFDGSIWPLLDEAKLQSPLSFKIKQGIVVDIIGDRYRYEIKKKMKQKKIGDGKSVQHFTLGLNPLGRISGNMLMDERVSGALTLGIGHSYSHFDITTDKPTIFLDDEKFVENGKFIDIELSELSKKLIVK